MSGPRAQHRLRHERWLSGYPAKDRRAGMSERQVWRILDSLAAKGAIVVTKEGGNKVFKGAATVYKMGTPPQRPKGDTDDTLHDADSGTDGGDKSRSKGDISDTKGDISGQTRVTPMSPHQVIHQVNNHHSDSSESASLASQATAQPDQVHDADDGPAVEAFLEQLNDELGLDQQEMNAADAMWQSGMHPNAVRNTINKQRLGSILNDVNQDQKRLDEDPRCKTCGVTMSRHAQWLADSGDRHVFATTVT